MVVLVDGLHSRELIEGLVAAVGVADNEFMLVYVHGRGPRASLDMLRHRPGGAGLPPARDIVISDAEHARARSALDEAEQVARDAGATTRRFEVDGEPGRAVCDVARREHADIVAVRIAGKDRPPVGPRTLGPAARWIADHAACPVLLLRGR
jgi:nucleotide-binding universal stress UspA family protein